MIARLDLGFLTPPVVPNAIDDDDPEPFAKGPDTFRVLKRWHVFDDDRQDFLHQVPTIRIGNARLA